MLLIPTENLGITMRGLTVDLYCVSWFLVSCGEKKQECVWCLNNSIIPLSITARSPLFQWTIKHSHYRGDPVPPGCFWSIYHFTIFVLCQQFIDQNVQLFQDIPAILFGISANLYFIDTVYIIINHWAQSTSIKPFKEFCFILTFC